MSNGKGFPTEEQVSAGGVVYREAPAGLQVAIVQVPPQSRWQLPKGLVDQGETAEETALREVREESGIEAEIVAPLETIEYWYVGGRRGRRIRYHKFVHFFLMKYIAGDVNDHDWEVLEARWVSPEEALAMLAFEDEQGLVRQAVAMIASGK